MKNTTCNAALRRRRRGFSLIEALVASTLLVLTVTGVLNGVSAGLRAREHQTHLTNGLQVAESLMEQLLLAYSNHADLGFGNHTRYFDRTGRDRGATADFYTARWNISALSGAQSGMRRIVLTVQWTETGGTKNISLTSDR